MVPPKPEDLHVGMTLWRDKVAWMIADIDAFQGEITLARPRVERSPVLRTFPIIELEERGYILPAPP